MLERDHERERIINRVGDPPFAEVAIDGLLKEGKRLVCFARAEAQTREQTLRKAMGLPTNPRQ